jgi:hypothetical protein
MGRIRTVIGAAVLLLLGAPAHSYAWWEFLEEFSGPRKFYGWDIQVRLFCLVDTVEKRTVTTGTRTREVRVVDSTEKQMPSAIGVLVSSCTVASSPDPGKVHYARRLSVDLGARFLSSRDDRFANGERIDFTTLEPSISFNLFSRWPNRDFLDYGFGAGAYWFSSTEFPSFNGAFIEPVRFEFHPTTTMKQKGWAAAIPSLRVAWLNFPAGFDTASWAAGPGIAPRLSRDWVFNLGIFFDLEPLLRGGS